MKSAPIVIDTQPADFFGDIGDEISFSLTARGSGLSYQWQLSINGGSTWSNSTGTGYNTARIYGFDVTEERYGRLYRCKITDSSGNVLYSQPGEIREDKVAIVTQPEDFAGRLGDTAKFSIKARGSGLTYQWQVSTNGGSSWGDSTAAGYKTANASLPIKDTNPGYLYRCKVTDSAGNVAYSEPGEIILLTETWNYKYNADGLRTQRSNGNKTYKYVYNGGQLSQMTVGSDTLTFGYDAGGTPMYVQWNSSRYFYVTNL